MGFHLHTLRESTLLRRTIPSGRVLLSRFSSRITLLSSFLVYDPRVGSQHLTLMALCLSVRLRVWGTVGRVEPTIRRSLLPIGHNLMGWRTWSDRPVAAADWITIPHHWAHRLPSGLWFLTRHVVTLTSTYKVSSSGHIIFKTNSTIADSNHINE